MNFLINLINIGETLIPFTRCWQKNCLRFYRKKTFELDFESKIFLILNRLNFPYINKICMSLWIFNFGLDCSFCKAKLLTFEYQPYCIALPLVIVKLHAIEWNIMKIALAKFCFSFYRLDFLAAI